MLQAKRNFGRHRRDHRVWLGNARYTVRDVLAALIACLALLAAVGWTALPAKSPHVKTPPPAGLAALSDVSSVYAEYSQHLFDAGASTLAAVNLQQAENRNWPAPTERTMTVAVLSGVFSTIIAFSLWFLRHLGRVYASPWPGHRRRGPGGRYT